MRAITQEEVDNAVHAALTDELKVRVQKFFGNAIVEGHEMAEKQLRASMEQLLEAHAESAKIVSEFLPGPAAAADRA